jgi:hypothetical protein
MCQKLLQDARFLAFQLAGTASPRPRFVGRAASSARGCCTLRVSRDRERADRRIVNSRIAAS